MDTVRLAGNSGLNGKKTYVAVDGKVYDISASHAWKDGRHFTHSAGMDLTEAMKIAPHRADVLQKYPVIAEACIAPDSGRSDAYSINAGLKGFLRKLRLHFWLIHFPVALFVLAPVFYVIFLYTHRWAFERTSFHLFAAAVLAAPFAVLSGYAAWYMNYGTAFTRIFYAKIFLAVLLLIAGAVCLRWRVNNPMSLVSPSGPNLMYAAMLGIPAVIVVILACLGKYGIRHR